MSQKELDTINDKWDFEMDNDGYQQFMTYQPFSINYWSQKVKIVFCNLETYDETISGILDLGVYKKWLLSGSQTIKYSSLIISAINNELTGNHLSATDLSTLYQDNDYLLKSVMNITYMNLRKDANTIRKEDTQALHEFLDPNFTRIKDNVHHISNFRNIIKALEPDVFIISGKTGADIVSKIYKKEMNLVYDRYDYLDSTLCISIAHPSTSKCDYNYILQKAQFVAQEINKKEI